MHITTTTPSAVQATSASVGGFIESCLDKMFRQELEFPLVAHEGQEFAYYVSPDLKPIPFTQFEEVLPWETIVIPEESQREQIYRNVIKVSEVNNPFTFANLNTYTVGTGIIRNMMSNSMRVSEGQFGQYPLYVFTTENIYALNVGQEILYSTVSPVSNETPTSDLLCQTPFGIIFIGKRGLFVINGQQVDHITPNLETYPTQITLDLPAGVPRVAGIKVWNDFFLEYLKTITEMVYDAKESEIILVNPAKSYNFVYNIDSKVWYQQTEAVDIFVKNVFPELYGIKGTSVKDFSIAKTTTTGEAPNEVTTIDKAEVSLITRPINFGSFELKRFEKIVLRALIQGDDLILLTNSSIDDMNFDLEKGMIFNNGNYKDFNLGMFTKKYRNVILMFAGKLSSTSKIFDMEVLVEQAYKNNKLI
jgi:hypothetical protein